MSLSSSAPWLKYYGNVPHHLSYPQKTIYQMVKAAAERNPKLPAYEFMGKKDDLHAVHAEDRRDGAGVSRHGHQKGDRVTICMPNCPQALHAFYGLNRIGAVSNMIHPLSAAGRSGSISISRIPSASSRLTSSMPRSRPSCPNLITRNASFCLLRLRMSCIRTLPSVMP